MAPPQKSRLGRGLGGLISAAKPLALGDRCTTRRGHVAQAAAGYLEIQVNLIEPSPYQARREIARPSSLRSWPRASAARACCSRSWCAGTARMFQLIAGRAALARLPAAEDQGDSRADRRGERRLGGLDRPDREPPEGGAQSDRGGARLREPRQGFRPHPGDRGRAGGEEPGRRRQSLCGCFRSTPRSRATSPRTSSAWATPRCCSGVEDAGEARDPGPAGDRGGPERPGDGEARAGPPRRRAGQRGPTRRAVCRARPPPWRASRRGSRPTWGRGSP